MNSSAKNPPQRKAAKRYRQPQRATVLLLGRRTKVRTDQAHPPPDYICNFAIVDKLTKEQRRKNMQAVKATGSKIEVALAKALFARGHRYRKNDKNVFGKPDLTFKKFKLAIFVDSEFWHGKDWATRKQDHKSNQDFSHAKIERNIHRDKEVSQTLKKDGWKVLRFWGKQIEKKLDLCILKIEKTILEQREKYK